MSLRVHDTRRREKVPFSTRQPGRVGMYVCGVTVYDRSHLGHARAYVAFDIVRRWLEASGYDVLHVQNHTDIDDKIIARANEAGEAWDSLTERMITAFLADMDALNVRRAHHYPRATESIPGMVEMIEGLIERGHAYAAEDGVWFSVDSAPEKYGQLTGQSMDAVQSGASGRLQDSGKRDHKDFALWKLAKPGEPSWPSPWGDGRPGWHIECSVMSRDHLGDEFDIHGGGADLKFPHHEAEIMQTECFTGHAPSVRYWMHNGHLKIDGEKMSKSLDNFWTIEDILSHHTGLGLRYALLNAQYRQPMDVSEQGLEEAELHASRLADAYGAALTAWERATLDTLPPLPEPEAGSAVPLAHSLGLLERFAQGVAKALDDDFNTRDALAKVQAAAREISRMLESGDLDGEDRRAYGVHALEWLEEFAGRVLGVLPSRADALAALERAEAAESGRDARKAELAAQVEPLLEQRAEARAAKDWGRADAIRDELTALGVVVTDTADGPAWDLADA